MSYVIFSGCSFTAGSGWDKKNPCMANPLCPDLWVNLCHTNIKELSNLELLNVGIPGGSNTEIFESVVNVIANYADAIDTIFCQWTSMPRYNFNIGLELWDTSEGFIQRQHPVRLSSGEEYSREYITNLIDRIKAMHHLHYEILKVVKYTNIISNLAKKFNIKLFHINGLCPWDNNYFTPLSNVTPEDYTHFTKTAILNIKNRPDQDIFYLYKQVHRQYNDAGGINESDWINLYSSFLDNRVDTNFDGGHPGTKSNHLYFNLVKNFLGK